MVKKIYIIAGEASGDLIGAKLITALQEKYDVEVFGVGGSRMEEIGFSSLFPMSDLSLMGFVEILPHAPKLFKRIKQTINHIKQVKPDVLVTIDSPGFNFKIAKALNQEGLRNAIRLVHYVAPTVWAYKPKRAEKIAKLYDHLLVLLPFEPLYFEKEGLKTSFVGHPIIEENLDSGDGKKFKKENNISANTKVILMLPGSRITEVKRIMPVFVESINNIQKNISDFVVVIPVVGALRQYVESELANWQVKHILVDQKQKIDAYAAADFALCKSGTVSLELAIAKIPQIVAYKVNPMTAFALRKIVKTPYFNLVNIIANRQIIPELMQGNCTAENLSSEMEEFLRDKDKASKQVAEAGNVLSNLKADKNKTANQLAAEIVFGV